MTHLVRRVGSGGLFWAGGLVAWWSGGLQVWRSRVDITHLVDS